MYNHQTYGRFWVVESIAEITQDQLEGLTQHNGDPGNRATLSLVKLANGATALAIDGDTATSVEWLVDAKREVDIVVVGPNRSFSVESATDIANKIAGA
jgi:hypothetical protein